MIQQVEKAITTTPREEMEKPIIELKDISMYFPGVKALDGVSFKLHPGECIALAGENGAGKSTLSKIILGAYQPTNGSVIVDGKNVTKTGYSIKHAHELGITAVHQELQLIPELNGYENIFLGNIPNKFGFINKKEMILKAKEIFEFLDTTLNLNTPVKYLRMAEQQIIQLAKALVLDARVIILDELTAVLQEKDIENIYRIVEILKNRGIGIIYISHRLDEIFRICDTYAVLVDGKLKGTGKVTEINKDQLIEMMIGRELTQVFPPLNEEIGDVALEVNNLTSPGAFSNISLKVRKGEVIGIAGLVGAGKTELLNAIFGNYKYTAGEIKVNGKKVLFKSPKDAVKHGVGLVPDERKQLGLAMNFNIKQNMTLASLNKVSNVFIDRKKEKDFSLKHAELMNIKYSNLEQLVVNLSGGNQQKVVIAKWIIADSEILMFDEPTRGIDVGAKAEIYKLINELSKNGKAIIIVSPELEELIGLCHKIHVMFEGEMKKTVSDEEKTQENIINSLLGEGE